MHSNVEFMFIFFFYKNNDIGVMYFWYPVPALSKFAS